MTRGAATLLVLAFAGWLTWATAHHTSPEVSSQLEGFDIVDQHNATAVLEVELSSPTVVATCRVRAIAEDHAIVGQFNFTPDDSTSRRQVLSIRTEREATTVESLGCTAPGQARPR